MSHSLRHPMRVAHVALQMETGGMERLLVEFAKRADRFAFEPLFICLGSRGPIAKEIESCGSRVIALDTPHGVRPSLIFRLSRLFKDERVDVVHTHNTKPLLYAGPAARLASIGAVVHTRHGQRHGSTRRQTMLFRLAARCADRVVCVSSDSERLCRAEGIASASLCTIPNGIDSERFAGCGPKAGAPAVYVGRLTSEKDLATLIEATAIAIRRQPSFRLVIAGGGPCATELVALARTRGVDRHVRFVGDVSDVPALLRESSLFVLPSRTEGMPLTAIEAMSCGLPVVATRVGGTPEVVVDGECGLLVAPGDAPALANAMLALFEDPFRAKALGESGQRRARERFDVRTMVAGYESLYRAITQTRAAVAA